MMNNDVKVIEVAKEENIMDVKVIETKEDGIVENKVRRFCNHCGKEMWVVVGSRQSVCDECKEKAKAENARLAHERAVLKRAKENLVSMNITMKSEVRDALKARSKEKGMSVGDFLKELLNVEIAGLEVVKHDIA